MPHPSTKLPRLLARGLVRGYQLIISPYFPSTCRYTPSCSEYAMQAIDRYGAAKGTVLAIHRVGRCHPWGGSGYDPPRWYGEERDDGSGHRDGLDRSAGPEELDLVGESDLIEDATYHRKSVDADETAPAGVNADETSGRGVNANDSAVVDAPDRTGETIRFDDGAERRNPALTSNLR